MSESLDRSQIADWIPGYSFGGDTLEVDISAEGGLSELGLTAAEANATTGDVAEVLRTIMESVYSHFLSVPAAQRTQKMTITKSISPNAQTGVLQKTYSLRVDCAAGDISVIPEE